MTASAHHNGYGEAGVPDMAARREQRALEQLSLLEKRPGCCVACLTMNTAGPVKRTPLIDRAFFFAAARLVNALAGEGTPLRLEKLILANTGDEALFTVRGDAEKVKRALVRLEEESPLGRLFDMDVIGADGRKLGRSAPRKCLLCNENAAVCARSRSHSVRELQQKTAELIAAHLAENAAALACEALAAEVRVTPKAGLVDKNNSGANPDMDLAMFERSAEALRPFFGRIALAVLTGGEEDCPLLSGAALSSPELAKELRSIGVEAEKAMLEATGGVNTHRGAIWSMGILTAAYARLTAEPSFAENENGELTKPLLEAVKTLAAALGDGAEPGSKGAKVRRKYGVGGPVEAAAAGFPEALTALEARREYRRAKAGDGATVDPWAYALLAVMAEMDDNNALRRGGEDGAGFVKKRAAELLEAGKTLPFRKFLDELLAFDRELTERNISCGGAADMLACAIFIDRANSSFSMRDERFIRAFAAECAQRDI